MNYAMIENRLVTNLIYLHPANTHEFINAVPIGDRPVVIDDAYKNGAFTWDGGDGAGGGGGGSWYGSAYTGGSGGSGIVVIRNART